MEESMGEFLGFMEQFFVKLGVWDDMGVALTVVIMIGAASAVINFAGGRR